MCQRPSQRAGDGIRTRDVQLGKLDVFSKTLEKPLLPDRKNRTFCHKTQGFPAKFPATGPHTIEPASALPQITDPVILDGYTQSGAAPASESTAATLLVELAGAGLSITAGDSVVRGLAINRAYSAINVAVGGGNVIEGNYLGTDVTGTTAHANQFYGVSISASRNNTIGGTTPAARNLIGGFDEAGLFMAGSAYDPSEETSGNVVAGNYIGVDVAGTHSLDGL